jgi:hypothetical protein
MAGIIRGSLHAGALAVMTWGYLELSGTVIDTWIRTQTVSALRDAGQQGMPGSDLRRTVTGRR